MTGKWPKSRGMDGKWERKVGEVNERMVEEDVMLSYSKCKINIYIQAIFEFLIQISCDFSY